MTILRGEALDRLRELPDESIEACVCDPPYGLSRQPDMAEVLRHWLAGDDYEHTGGGFMGESWDSFVPGPSIWREVSRVLKPGGYLLAFGGSRTSDLLSTAIRLAGFEVRDTITWLYGQGFPKSRSIGKALDERAGVEREVIGSKLGQPGYSANQTRDDSVTYGVFGNPEGECAITAPATPEAERWEGWGTALKPGYEPIVVARKPFKGPVELNVLEHGTGAINVDANRIPVEGGSPSVQRRASSPPSEVADRRAGEGRAIVNRSSDEAYQRERSGEAAGRFPPNVLLTHSPGCHQVGAREVRSGGHGDSAGGWAKGYSGGGDPGHDVSGGYGREVVGVWECEDGCPVAAIDGQPTRPVGRFPPNVLLTHSPGCHQVGEREVANGTAVNRRRDGSEHTAEGWGYRKPIEDVGYGREVLGEWKCEPGCPVAQLDDQAGELRSGAESKGGRVRNTDKTRTAYQAWEGTRREEGALYGDTGAASRFFPTFEWDSDELVTEARMLYVAKANPAERVAGLAGGPETEGYVTGLRGFATIRRCPDHDAGVQSGSNAYSCGCPVLYAEGGEERTTLNPHPTVKPIDLMRWLVRLVTPPGGRVLDPYLGSGTTLCAAALEGFDGIGIERDPDFIPLAERRVAFWQAQPVGMDTRRVVEGDRARQRVADTGQESLL